MYEAKQMTTGTANEHDSRVRHRGRTFWNWTAAVLALVASLAVVAFAYAQVLGTAACTDQTCGGTGPNETVFGLILYGTPIVGLLAVLASFFTARRRTGFVVPLVAWLAVVAALVVLLGTF